MINTKESLIMIRKKFNYKTILNVKHDNMSLQLQQTNTYVLKLLLVLRSTHTKQAKIDI